MFYQNSSIASSASADGSLYAYGGAISNESTNNMTSLTLNEDSFVGNNATATYSGSSSIGVKAQGGAIYIAGTDSPKTATVNIRYNSLFDSNKAAATSTATAFASGGAIFNGGFTNLEVDAATYTKNSAVVTTTGNNSNDSVDAQGGAIANLGNATIFNSTFNKNYVSANSNVSPASANGGAIFNDGSVIIQNSTFESNYVTSNAVSMSKSSANGGAIMNGDEGILNVVNSIFKDNYTDAVVNTISRGGAISNAYKAFIANCYFTGNGLSSSTVKTGYGGAIYNNSKNPGTEMTIVNSSFIGNKAELYGGAIYNGDVQLNIVADKQNTIFSDNYAMSNPNDICLNGSTLNLNAGNGGVIEFNDGIVDSNSSTINVNKSGTYVVPEAPTIVAPTAGQVIFNAPLTEGNSHVNTNLNLYSGTLSLAKDNYIDNSNLTLLSDSANSTRTLNLMNNNIGTMSLNSLAVSANTNLKIDADLAARTCDKITAVTYGASSSKLNVSAINIMHGSSESSISTQLLDGALVGKNLVNVGVSRVYSPIYAYNVNYNDATGQLMFNTGSGGSGSASNFNPAVISSPVSTNTGAYMTQISMYNQILDRADLLTALPYSERTMMRNRNKVAELGGSDVNTGVFSPLMTQDEEGGLWFKEYTTFENIPLSNGPNVSNVGYGTLIGGDMPMKHYRNGWDGVTTLYASYNGSHQNYDNVGVYQNGGALGITETLFKGDFFTSLTASVGDSYGQANTMYGVDNFNTLLAGVASKTGYNIRFAHDKFIFQPSIFLSYTFAKTFDYTTASGLDITSNNLNAIQVAPGAKLIYNAEDGWQPYIGVNLVFNIMDEQKFYANNVSLPQMSIDPYFEYGLGIQRRWGDKFTGFAQAMLRGGGRNGIALMFGFRIAIGK